LSIRDIRDGKLRQTGPKEEQPITHWASSQAGVGCYPSQSIPPQLSRKGWIQLVIFYHKAGQGARDATDSKEPAVQFYLSVSHELTASPAKAVAKGNILGDLAGTCNQQPTN
jgi:hypothetical protein